MRPDGSAACVLCLVTLSALPVAAQTPTCDKLDASARTQAKKLLASQYPYECCDETILQCLGHERVCALAYRLAENICRRVAMGQSSKQIAGVLSRRANSMMLLG